MKAIILRIIHQMKNDKRSLALILFVPILIMTFMYLVYGDTSYVPKIAFVNVPTVVQNVIIDQNIEVVEVSGDTDQMLIDKTIDGVVYIDNSGFHL